MTKVIRFSKLRYIMFTISVLLIIAGIAGTVGIGGFNLGIDFQAGLNQRVQIAPVAMEVSYNGEANASLDISDDTAVLEVRGEAGVEKLQLSLADYSSMADFAAKLESVEGISVKMSAPSADPSDIVTGLEFPLSLEADAHPVNVRVDAGDGSVAIDQVRSALGGFENPQVQVVGDPAEQEFLLRIADPSGEKKDQYEKQIVESLEAVFGQDTSVVKQSDYVGPRFSQDLANQSVGLTLMALVLILIYIWVRFKLGFAVSAISALVHDVAIMLGFIGIFQLEVSTTTIAAVLTIVGYSLNDTIVVFDRVRENMGLMKERSMKDIVDTSITQSLSRTLMTSLTTLLAVLALFFFGTGAIKDFALNLIVGIFVGTYSSIFIASPVLLGLTNIAEKRRAKKDPESFVPKKPLEEKESDSIQAPVEIPSAERKLKGKRKKKKK